MPAAALPAVRAPQTDITNLVSVVIPCLNRVRYVAQTIESVLEQNHERVECIVVDGGSTDGTVEVLRSYGNRIRYVSEPDAGHADAINKGWRMSRGEILAWLNADDCYVVPGAVRTAVSYLEAHPGVDLVYGDYAVMAEDGSVEQESRRARQWNLVHAVKYCAYTIPQPTAFIRRAILERVGWLDPTYHLGKDHELWLRIGLVGMIRYIPCTLAYARATPGLSQEPGAGESKIRITREFFRRSDLPPSFADSALQRRAFSNAYLVAAEYAWAGGHRDLFQKYLPQSAREDVWNLPYIGWRLLLLIVRTLTPPRWRALVRRRIKFGRIGQQ